MLMHLYIGKKVFGKPEARDDIDSLTIMKIEDFIKDYKEILVNEHIVLGEMLVNFIKKNK